ncbi:hypothetical protein NEIMUCOT_03838 [Neisseria mucosa ATCC 25996]|uniref:Uncharacterized protein n=1 Tax=Neisseria mucosa (strain ATCC 25996 / DSM 4631 / NCTC 10774 / M26) TaxID=546266 RepID=D2ZTA3_NEIM2|nr:hypothetical protein NEIMUCOT_03838 [Neisseria mucosa ATCC 25996]
MAHCFSLFFLQAKARTNTPEQCHEVEQKTSATHPDIERRNVAIRKPCLIVSENPAPNQSK